ncbi:MAG TPA: CBS and ACT domain-containing protein [bacterium]|nr:CBS domain-containing protein [Dictyoglomota bacterium]HON72925.1 CBS and ACT domain-containing protein [bacterium]
MFVRWRMTPNPIVIDPQTSILDALHIMKEKKVRRLPVVAHGKLVGIVTEKDLRESPSLKATSLSIFELNYLLAKTPVSEVMTKDPITVTPDTTIEEAAVIMRDNQISGLPVVDDGKIVGIVTETDIFDMLVKLLGFRNGARFTLHIENRVGAVADLAGIFKDLGINIISIVAFEEEREEEGNVVVRVDTKDTEKVVSALKSAGIKVIHFSR